MIKTGQGHLLYEEDTDAEVTTLLLSLLLDWCAPELGYH